MKEKNQNKGNIFFFKPHIQLTADLTHFITPSSISFNRILHKTELSKAQFIWFERG